MDDIALLEEYARTGAEAAFAALVQRHIGLVYSAACRQLRDAQLAEDVTQTVFVLLAKRAASLTRHPGLSGWLLQTTRNTAKAHIRTAVRRARREQEAAMQSGLNDSSPAVWSHIEPYLDEAMASLGATDRAVLALRYFENKTAAETGLALQLNEDAAKKRAHRALEKLRKFFAKKGVAVSTGAIAVTLTAHAIQTAPAGLAASITTAALSGGATTTATLFASTKAITMITLQKIAIPALVVAIGAGAYEANQAATARAEVDQLRQQQSAQTGQIKQLQAEHGELANRPPATAAPATDTPAELLRLRGEVGMLKTQAAEAGQKAEAAEKKLAGFLSTQKKFDAHQDAAVNASKMLGLTMRLYAMEHNDQFPTNFEQFKPQLDNSLGYSKEYTNAFSLGGVDLHSFEFVNGGVVKNASAPEFPNLPVLRERLARQAPDGTWNRIYLFADGSAHVATSYEGHFEAWEKANTYAPPDQN